METETLLSILVGIGLSAACGFRVFVPLLVMSIASLSGHLTLSSGTQWVGTYPALLALAVATILEILGYYIPWVDHFLDLISTPAAITAGILAMGGAIHGMSPFLRWTLAVIAGGGIAGGVQAITGMTRLASAATTGGLGNPLIATAELGGSTLLSVLAIIIPLIAAALVFALIYLALTIIRKRKKGLQPNRA
jgi:hypothetical protein